ncbi:MarR family transcriptional regulator [Vibrio comitans]
MRLAHKRNVQMKLQKRIKTSAKTASSKPVVKAEIKPAVATPAAAEAEVKVENNAEVKASDIALTPKQQQVLDIVVANAEGINPKGIGLQAGQEESKAASWATGALKKLLTENLVQREQLSGNKVIYKAL